MRPVAASVLAKLRWLDRHEPQLASSGCTVLLGAHDYVVGMLCGKWVTDCTTASTTGLALLHSPGEGLMRAATTQLSYSTSLVCTIGHPGWLLWSLSMNLAASFWARPQNCLAQLSWLVCPSSTPAATPALALSGRQGVEQAYQEGAMLTLAHLGRSLLSFEKCLHCSWVAGTFLRDRCQANKDVVRRKARFLGMPPSAGVLTLAHVHEDYVFRTGSIMTAGGNLHWASSLLGSASGPLSMGEMDELAKSAPLAGRGLLYLPFLAGERCPIEDANLRVALIGCQSSTTRSEVARAVMEGVAMGLRSARDAMLVEGACTLPEAASSPLRVVGGGARSLVWPKYLAAIMGQPVDVIADAQDVGVKGAALLAGCWLGWHQTLAPEGDWVSVKWRVEPADADIAAYSELHELYLQACAALVPTFAGLASFRASHCP
eukprot:SM000081S22690  [mRNA]  locus=s81:567100:571076:- [translate_table: standard]